LSPAKSGAARQRSGGAVPGLAARTAATSLLADVVDRRQPLDARLEAGDTPYSALTGQDRALARAIVSIALRRYGQIRNALGLLIERPLPRRAGSLPRLLEIATTQILFMEVADHAAVSLALEAAERDGQARHFKPLANGVLRSLVRRRDEILGGQDAERLNTPDWLWDSWVSAYGEETARAIATAHLGEPDLDISVKSEPADWAERLGGTALPTGTIRLHGGGRIEEMPGFADGAWWVQDAAAALPARLLGDVAGKRVADLCAAPGGKTAQLAAAGAKVTAVDSSRDRMKRLSANLGRLGLTAETVVADATAYESAEAIDAVLIDAPCSATGTIRRHPDIQLLKGPDDVAKLAGIQRRLLEQAAALVRPGGMIVFATCSLQSEEGPAIANDPGDLSLEPLPIVPDEVPGLRGEWLRDGRIRTLPCHHASESAVGLDGFFAARFRRK